MVPRSKCVPLNVKSMLSWLAIVVFIPVLMEHQCFGDSITIFSVFGADTVVEDGGPGDLDPLPNVIKATFTRTGVAASWTASGTVTSTFAPGLSATTILTDLTIRSLVLETTDTASGAIGFRHDFGALGPPAVSTASLDGLFRSSALVLPILSGSAKLKFEPFVNTADLIGNIDTPSAAGAIGTAHFDGSSGPIFVAPVTNHFGVLSFTLGKDENIEWTNEGFNNKG